MRAALGLIALASALGCQGFHRAPDVAPRPAADGLVVLHNGSNAVDLLGDGTPAEVFVAWRGNFNAHGHSTVAFYIEAPSDLDDSIPGWQIVPAFGGPGDGKGDRELLGTTEGADCTLGDLRLLQHHGSPAELIVARRDLQRSYADSEPTHFDYYTLTRNSEGTVGWPPYYFRFVRTVDAHREYCDVNIAFEKELRLGRHGVGRGEASQ